MKWDELDDSPAAIRAVLDERGLALKKRWGQNFMISRHARRRVVDLLESTPGETVWEIGSGLGAITSMLVDAGDDVTVFEVDYGLMAVIRERFGDRVSIVDGDAVKTIPVQVKAPDRIIGNLPYRSAAAIISAILESPTILAGIRRMVFTVQREMAVRMVAGPGSGDYSPFSVLIAATSAARLAGDLSRGNFYPAPEVTSSIVMLDPRPHDAGTSRMCSLACRALFSQRRKTIANNAGVLARELGMDVATARDLIASAEIPLDARAEQIPPERYLALGALLVRSRNP